MDVHTLDAEYECCGCRHRWLFMRGPQQCPKCKGLYVKWLNYEETCGNGKTNEQAGVVDTGNLSSLRGTGGVGDIF